VQRIQVGKEGTMTGETTDTIILDPPPTNEDDSPQAQKVVQQVMEASSSQRWATSMTARRIAET